MTARRGLPALAFGLAFAGPAAAGCEGLAGEYYLDVRNEAFAAALRRGLGADLGRFEDRFQTIVPFEEAGDGTLFATGCRQHECTVEEAFLGVEAASCVPYVALREGGEVTQTFPDLKAWPAALVARFTEWRDGR